MGGGGVALSLLGDGGLRPVVVGEDPSLLQLAIDFPHPSAGKGASRRDGIGLVNRDAEVGGLWDGDNSVP